MNKIVPYQIIVPLFARRLMKTVPEVDLNPVPRSHPRTPDIQTVAGSVLWSSKHSFVHIGYAFYAKDHFYSHSLLSVAVVGYWRIDVHKVMVNRSGLSLLKENMVYAH